MGKEIVCPKCDSVNIRKAEGPDDFLSYKGEGEPAKKSKTKTKQKYSCIEEKCGYEWEEDLVV